MAKEYHSRHRTRILQYFEEQPDRRMSAAGIYGRMAEEGIKVNLATVYRNAAGAAMRGASASLLQPLRQGHPSELRIHA